MKEKRSPQKKPALHPDDGLPGCALCRCAPERLKVKMFLEGISRFCSASAQLRPAPEATSHRWQGIPYRCAQGLHASKLHRPFFVANLILSSFRLPDSAQSRQRLRNTIVAAASRPLKTLPALAINHRLDGLPVLQQQPSCQIKIASPKSRYFLNVFVFISTFSPHLPS